MIYVIGGATGSGKTTLALDFARRINAQIINADAFQVYRGLDIGTNKLPILDRNSVIHHLIDIVDPSERYDIARYQIDARQVIKQLEEMNVPIVMVGGSGLYIRAVLYDYYFPEQTRLVTDKKNQPTAELYQKLTQVDAITAATIHPHNRQRVIRALEIFEATGTTKSEHLQMRQPKLLYDATFVGIRHDRQQLYDMVNERVLDMFKRGLLEEARHLFQTYGSDVQSLQAIGYKQLIAHLKGEASLEKAIVDIQLATRHYIKRQDTFFNLQLPMKWFTSAAQASDYLLELHHHG